MEKTKVIRALAVAFTVIALAGCQSRNQNNPEESAAANGESAPAGPASSSKNAHLAHRPAEQTPAPPATQTVTVPAGTEVHIRLSDALSSATASSGTTFQGSLAQPLAVNGLVVASRGSLVAGQVTNAISSGRLKRPAELSLVLTSITPEGGQDTAIATRTWSLQTKSHKKRNLTMIGGGAGLGAAIGAIAGGGKGAAIGSMVGAGAGTAGAYATGKKEIELPAETQLTFALSAPANFTIMRAP